MKLWPLIFLLASGVAVAEIGSVETTTGTAVIKRGSSTVSISKGTLVEMNDRIETKSGQVNIRFKDDTTVKVTENSALVIDDFVYDPKSKSGKLGLKAAEGTVRYVSGNIAHNNPNAVNIKTPTATIAVRGTDFVMAVDETGKSLVMLMPTCEENVQIVNLKGLVCGSGKIDVDSGGHVVHLDKPYQATIVETYGDAPSAPIIVNLFNTPIGNNLIIRPPQIIGGSQIQAFAKSAAQKTGDVRREDRDERRDANGASNAEIQTTDRQQHDRQLSERSQREQEDAAAASIVQKELDLLASAGVNVKTSPEQDTHVKPLFKNSNPNLQQIGWGFESLSANGRNYTDITLTNDTKVLVVVTQDRVTDAYNFNGANSKPVGSIVISQSYR